jgi:predicted DNA-binding protein (UPF0251 family)
LPSTDPPEDSGLFNPEPTTAPDPVTISEPVDQLASSEPDLFSSKTSINEIITHALKNAKPEIIETFRLKYLSQLDESKILLFLGISRSTYFRRLETAKSIIHKYYESKRT